MEEVEKAERLIDQLPVPRNRLWEIDELVSACEAVIKSDHPGWTRDKLRPSHPFVQKIPVRLGNAGKTALDVLRVAERPTRVKEIAIEVLRREGHENSTTDEITRVANAIGSSLKNVESWLRGNRFWPAGS